tara:strand:+ start:258 stop:551 length:294 start_codon:yes stop_codon:yes gene_type:complete
LVKILLIKISLLLLSCSTIDNSNQLNEKNLEEMFYASSEYKSYKDSKSAYLTVVKVYKVKELGFLFTARDSGEATAFINFIKSNTELSIVETTTTIQ